MDLYKIEFLGSTYSYCSGSDNVVFSSMTYLASPITRTEIGLELNSSDVRISVPIEMKPFTDFVVSSPSVELTLTLIDYSSGYQVFQGIMTKIEFDRTSGLAEVTFQRKESFFDSEVPYRTYGTSCSFGLYSAECGVAQASHSITTNGFTFSVNRREVTIPELSGYPDGIMSGGYLRTNYGESVYILRQSSVMLYLDQPIINLPVNISVIKGCDKLFTTCKDKFNNSLNFGGFPFIPIKNPVSESI